MHCPDDSEVFALLGGSLDAETAGAVRMHLDECESCGELVATLVVNRRLGTSAGRYQISTLLGSGAMGQVYRARDPELGRDIALKLVRNSSSPLAQQRLLREAQSMAQIQHANVIRVYDVGTTGEDVFLAMELIDGETLSGWLKDDRHSWREVMAVLLQAGEGLKAAHDAGLQHRDFKPDNVLVARDGRVLVTDFGLVGVDERESEGTSELLTSLTQTGMLVGTPAYMAPEQFESTGSAAMASDQFSYCVTLYEALYRKRPFHGNTIALLRTAIENGTLPIETSRHVPRRVQKALRRGLSVLPTERFGSMADLLRELRTATSKRRQIATIAVLVSLGLLWSAFALTQTAQSPPCSAGPAELSGVWDGTLRSRLARVFEVSPLSYAKTIGSTTDTALQLYRADWLSSYAEACKATRVRRDQSTELLDVRMQCLGRRRVEFGATVAELIAGSDEVIREAATLVGGMTPVTTCDDLDALTSLAPLPDEPSLRAEVESLRAQLAKCRAMQDAAKYKQAELCTLALVAAADVLGYAPVQAELKLVLGLAQSRQSKWDEAESALEESVLAAERGRHQRIRVQALTTRIAVAAGAAKFKVGEVQARHADAALAGLGDDLGIAGTLAFHRAVLLFRQGKIKESLTSIESSISLRESLHGKAHPSVAEALVLRAVLEATSSDFDASETTILRAIGIQSASLGADHPAVARTQHTLSSVYIRLGRYQDALVAQQRSYEINKATFGEDHTLVATALVNAAHIHSELGDYEEAEVVARRIIGIHERLSGEDHPDTANALNFLGGILARQERYEEALAIKQRALAIREKTLGLDNTHTMESNLSVAKELRMLKQCKEALPLLERTRAYRVKHFGKENPRVASVLQTIADCHMDLGEPTKALASIEIALRILEARPIRSNSERVAVAMARFSVARALWDGGGDKKRARKLFSVARDDLRKMEDSRAKNISDWMSKRGIAE